jgi:hypothetical protein
MFDPIPFDLHIFDFNEWILVFFWMMIGITFAILTRREEITLPSKIGSKIKPGTLGQYIITFCLSFFMQAYGIQYIVAGLYAGAGGTIANQLQKVVTTKLSQAEMEEKLREMIDDFEAYKEYTQMVEGERERRVFQRIVTLLKKTPEEIGAVALKVLGLGNAAEPIVALSAEAIGTVLEHLEKEETVVEKTPILPPTKVVVETKPTPEVKMEMSVQEAKDLLRKATKKSIFSR